MILPTTRVTITLREYELLSPGLEILANGLATAKLGAFPHRHAWDRIDAGLSDIHRDRAYDEGMAQRIVSTRAKVIGMTATRKVRVDVFQISVAALALRLGRSKTGGQAIARSSETIREYDAFVRKLEKHRKRARRTSVADLGPIEFAKAAESWRKFNQWARYHFLQFKCENPPSSLRRLKAKDQRQAIELMIQLAIQERSHAPLGEQVLNKMVTLAKASFLRGRQPMTLKELLSSREKGREFLFAFVTTRVNMTPLPGAAIPPWKAAMERADKFQAYFDSQRQWVGGRPVLEVTSGDSMT
jgi:hypothetical protein